MPGKHLKEIPIEKIYVGMPVVFAGGKTKGEVIFVSSFPKISKYVLIEMDTGLPAEYYEPNCGSSIRDQDWYFDMSRC